MKKIQPLFKKCKYALVLVILFNITVLCSAYAGEKYKVIGSSYIGDMTQDTVLSLAKSEAERRAIEQAVKTVIGKNSKRDNVMILTDVVLSQNNGIIISEKWGKKWEKGGKLYIELTAEVEKNGLNEKYTAIEAALRANDLPRTGVIIKTNVVDINGTDLTETTPFSFYQEAFATGIKLYFTKLTPDMDIKFINADNSMDGEDYGKLFNKSAANNDQPHNMVFDELEVSAISEEDYEVALAVTRELGIDIAIVGTVNIVANIRDTQGIDVASFNISPHIEVIKTANSKLLAITEDSFTTKLSPVVKSQRLMIKSLKRLGLREGRTLMGQLVKHWVDNRYSCELIVKNASQRSITSLKHALDNLGGEQDFVVRSLRTGLAHIDFYSEFKICEVSEYLGKQTKVELDIESITEQGIIININ